MPSNIEKLLGIYIAKIRKEQGFTQSELADSIDVALETISRLERGISVPSLKTLENISNAFNIPIKKPFDFEYSQKHKGFSTEKEIYKLLAYLKTKRISEIKMSYRILKEIFNQIDKNSRLKR